MGAQRAECWGSRDENARRAPALWIVIKHTNTHRPPPMHVHPAATRASCGMKSSPRILGSALTLLIEDALIPSDASSRAYSPTRVRSARTFPPSKKIDLPA